MVELGGRHLNLGRFLHRARKSNIGHDRQTGTLREKLAQNFEPLADKIGRLGREAGDVVAWSGKARDETTPNRVRVDGKDDRNNRCGLLERWNSSAKCSYDVDFQSDELSRNLCVSLHAVFRPAMLDCDGSALDPAELAKPFQKRGVPRALRPTRSRAEIPDRRQLLLRSRRYRPHRRAAEQRDDLAPPHHSSTSSARASSSGEMVMPSAFAVVRLITRSNLVGCSTGMVPGFVPRRILSRKSPARRYMSTKLGP